MNVAESNEEAHFNGLHDAAYDLSCALVAGKPKEVIEPLRARLQAALERYWEAVEEERAERAAEGPDCMQAAHEASL